LGNTVVEIAHEKAAIIKEGTKKVFVSRQESIVLDIIKKRCEEFGIIPSVFGEKFSSYKKNVVLLGEHQRENASVAAAVAKSLNAEVLDIENGIANVFWPGRFEIVGREPVFVIDCAHNDASAMVLAKSFQMIFPTKKAILIFGVSDDKNKAEICRQLECVVSNVIFTKADHPRACDIKENEMYKLFPERNIYKKNNIADAISLSKEIAEKDDVILITGSIFIASEARKILFR
jgi:dihydrofolate synthase/folylpolyglutamate synthase